MRAAISAARNRSNARRSPSIGNYFDAWNTLGAIYVVEKRSAEAVQALNKATALRPASGQAQYNLALALQAAGDLERGAGRGRQGVLAGVAILPVICYGPAMIGT